MVAEKESIDWMFIAKGIGIFLVVVGHFDPPNAPHYWSVIRNIIYSFHMPLFFVLSGYLYVQGKYSYRDLVSQKIKRLLYPFCSIALIFFGIKFFAGFIVTLDHPVTINSIYLLVINPFYSYMPILWFIHALFIIFLVYPLLRMTMNNAYILLCCIIINSILGNDFLVLGKALANLPFFAIGIIIREQLTASELVISEKPLNILILIILFSSMIWLHGHHSLPYFNYAWKFLLGFIGSVLVINISKAISLLPDIIIKGMLVTMGYYSMTIYLFHTLFESAVRIGFIQILKNIKTPFEVMALVAIISGVIMPLLFEKKILRKFSVTRKFILGIT